MKGFPWIPLPVITEYLSSLSISGRLGFHHILPAIWRHATRSEREKKRASKTLPALLSLSEPELGVTVWWSYFCGCGSTGARSAVQELVTAQLGTLGSPSCFRFTLRRNRQRKMLSPSSLGTPALQHWPQLKPSTLTRYLQRAGSSQALSVGCSCLSWKCSFWC